MSLKQWYAAYEHFRKFASWRLRDDSWRMFVISNDLLVGWTSRWDIAFKVSHYCARKCDRALVLTLGWIVIIARLPRRFFFW